MNTTPKGSSHSGALPDELLYLLTAFLPSSPTNEQTKAFLSLSAFCQGVRSSSTSNHEGSDPNTEALTRVFSPLIKDRLAAADENDLLASVTFFAALFQVDRESASSIFLQDGVLETVMDNVDLTPSTQLARSTAQLLSHACGYKACRGVLSNQAIQWLDFTSQNSPDTNTRANATTALIKVSKGAVTDKAESLGNIEGVGNVTIKARARRDEDLAAALREIVFSTDDQASIPDAIEGLAYLSVNPLVKEVISGDTPLLKRLSTLMRRHKIVAQHPTETPTTLVFGTLLIVSNLCAHRPHLTEEQTQIQRLRQMTNSSNETLTSILDDDEHVNSRIQNILKAGLLEIFPLAIKFDTPGLRALASGALLSIVEDNHNRGKVLQSGGVKVLMQIIRHIDPDKPLEPAYLSAIQALAKLAITASPFQVFGPNEGAIYDAVRPLSIMLRDASSTLLQQFESMMALTNISSQSAEIATRISASEGLLEKVELLLLEDHTLVRRAAMELLCNLIAGSDKTFERYAGDSDSGSAKSRLHIVLALSDVEDLPTRLAASGALATLTNAPEACAALVALQMERHRVFAILAGLVDPSVSQSDEDDGVIDQESHPGLVHRAIVCTQNIFLSISDKDLQIKLSKEAEEAGLLKALTNIIKNQGGDVDPAVLKPAAEVLEMIVSKG